MSRRKDGSFACDDCPKDAQPGIRITALPALGGKPGGWRVSCLGGHEIRPEFGMDFIVAPGGRI